MCKAFSCWVLSNGDVKWKLGLDSHEDIAREFGIRMDGLKPDEGSVPGTQLPSAADDLYEGPATVKSQAQRPALPVENKLETSISPGPRYADAWPSEYRKAETDLHLTPDGRFLYGSERKSSTIAGFATAPPNTPECRSVVVPRRSIWKYARPRSA